MRIVMIISGLNVGGAEMTLLSLVDRLRREFEIQVVSLSDVGPIGERLGALHVPVHALGMRSGAGAPVAFFRLIRLLRKLRPDLVHTWMYHADCVGGLAARLTGTSSIIWSIHSFNIAQGMLRPTTRFLVKACAKLSWSVPTKIISCSEAGIDVHVRSGYVPEKFVFIPNGVDISRFKFIESARASVQDELGIAADAPIVGLVGRFDVQKNQVGFFEAASLIRRRHPNVRFVLAGNGVDAHNQALVRAVAEAGVSESTSLLGMREDIPRLISAMDVLVSPSLGEAFPLVLIEAMACGVPCAVTDVGDSGHIVGDVGRVVQSGDMKGLANAVNELLDMPAEERAELGRRAIARVRGKYDLARVVNFYKDFYRNGGRPSMADRT